MTLLLLAETLPVLRPHPALVEHLKSQQADKNLYIKEL